VGAELIAARTEPTVVPLADPRARDPRLSGAKAARLAAALADGLPALPGFVITTARDHDRPGRDLIDAIAVRSSWAQLSEHGTHPLVVRSSSTAEDGDTSSMAGLFTSIVNVRGWREFGEAVDRVVSSARDPGLGEVRPMAVLVQRYLSAAVGGVLFGADPITGDANRIIIAAAIGGPHPLVDGTAAGAQYTIGRHGRRVAADRTDEGPLTSRQLRRLARLAWQTQAVFGGPQDVEWAIDDSGAIRLLQSRPLTGVPTPTPRRAPVLGPGPIAETFPVGLSTLEEELWIPAMRSGLRRALAMAGAASPRRLRRSPVVTVVAGRAVADLDLLGPPRTGRRHVIARLVDPRPGMRRLRAAWRLGQLRASLPTMTGEVIAELDGTLAAVPPLPDLNDNELAALLTWSHSTLVVLHTHEVLAGLLMPRDDDLTASSIALRVLARGQLAGTGIRHLAEREPVVLALTPPSTGPEIWPRPLADPQRLGQQRIPDIGELPLREESRLRIRWVHELSARAAREAGARLAATGVLPNPEDVRDIGLADLVAALRHRRALHLAKRHSAQPADLRLPTAFRLDPHGRPVPVEVPGRRRRRRPGSTSEAGQPAGGGRSTGIVHAGDGRLPDGAVLVVPTLDPDLAVHLPRLAGLIAETGSPLSHLAILARELAVPVVVGVPAATERFPVGTHVHVDGTSGEIHRLDLPEQEPA
jgi:phosphohistidine swiveling domain-containing protein